MSSSSEDEFSDLRKRFPFSMEEMAAGELLESSYGCQNTSLVGDIKLNFDIAKKIYENLIDFACSAPSHFKSQLTHFVYPVFVHLYLELTVQNKAGDAFKFLKEFIYLFHDVCGYDVAMTVLRKVRSVEDVHTHAYFKLFRSGKYVVKLTEDCLEYFGMYIKSDENVVLLQVISLYFELSLKSEKGDFEPSVMWRPTNVTAGYVRNTHFTDESTEPILSENLPTIDNPYEFFSPHSSKSRTMPQLELADPSMVSRLSQKKKRKTSSKSRKKRGKKGVRSHPQKMCHNFSSDSENEMIALEDSSTKKMDEKLASLYAAFANVSKLPPCVPSICSYDLACVSPRNICNVGISWTGSLLASAFEDSMIELWSLLPKKLHSEDVDICTMSLVSSPNSWTCSERPMVLLPGHNDAVYGLCFNQKNNILLSCSGDTTIRAWDLNTYKNVVIYNGSNYPVWDVDFSICSSQFASASMDRTARLWNTERTHPLAMLVGHEESVRCVKYHPNGNYLATGSYDCTVKLWHAQAAYEVRCFSGHTGHVRAIAFSPNGKYLVSACKDQKIKIWDLAASRELCELPGLCNNIHNMSFNSSGSLLACEGPENSINIWNMEKCIKESEKLNADTESKINSDLYLLKKYSTQYSTLKFIRFLKNNQLFLSGLSFKPNTDPEENTTNPEENATNP